MRRNSWTFAGPLLALLALAACRDGVVSPAPSRMTLPVAAGPVPMSLAPQGRPSLALTGGLADSTSVDFYVAPTGGVFFTGNHAVVFPAGSICDPATSKYGPGTWDEPCMPLQATIRIHAEVRRSDGTTSIEFTPALRFVPSTNPAKWVWLALYSPDAVGSDDLSQFNIWWAPEKGAALVDETIVDATLRTYVDDLQGVALRRLKHFSMYESGGFGLASGKECGSGQEGC